MKILQHRDVLSVILAGGMGERLFPLTRDRAKPAVPFGGRYRIIDFALNNCVNSGLTKIKVLTQFKSNSLIEHIIRTWRLSFDIGQFVDPVPAQMRRGPHWFRGTADAVYQNLDLIFDEEPDHVCVFGGDHIYMMDVNPMLLAHEEGGHDVTIAAIPVPIAEASRFGILEVAADGRIVNFHEKPAVPRPMPSHPELALASMGNYIFRAGVLIDALEHDALQDTSHDFGKTIIPALLAGGAGLYAYDFSTNRVPGDEDLAPYWRDVGTIDSYFEASMDLISVDPMFSLYGEKWQLRTLQRQLPPTKCTLGGRIADSIVSDGCIVSGGLVQGSILSPCVIVERDAVVEQSVIFD
ncbi:MAG TPA: glucose-1-phosphate adenylyltransferase, partial [Thermoanaerobaculia bacterium]|nr:glucose-1-phosphate adenylyltransferase [Thermoanaerobaculia bacterium]